MMAYTQENIVSSTQENAENNLRTTRDGFDSLGAVQFCNSNYTKRPLPLLLGQKPKLKEKLKEQKKERKKKLKNGNKKKEKKKKKKLSVLDKSDDEFRETVACLQMLSGRCGQLVLICKDTMTLARLNGFISILIEFLKKSAKEYLTKPSKACILKPFLNDVVYLLHMIYTDLKKFKLELTDRQNYLNKMSDLVAMIIDMEITASKLFSCKKCKDSVEKKFRTEAKLKEHLEKSHKMRKRSEGWWKDDLDSSSNIGISECERENLTSVLSLSLYMYLDESPEHILDTILKTSNKNKKKASKILSRIFSRILQSPKQPMSILDYARYILVLKMWKKMLDSVERQREIMRLAVSLLPSPPCDFREKVAMLDGIIPPLPKAKPDSAITEYCLSVKSVKSVKYELKDQIQKYLLLISDPGKVSELMKKLSFFSENRNDFDIKDSVFADDDMILYDDTLPVTSPAKQGASSIKHKNTDAKSKSSTASDSQAASSSLSLHSKIAAELCKREMVTSTNERDLHKKLAKVKIERMENNDTATTENKNKKKKNKKNKNNRFKKSTCESNSEDEMSDSSSDCIIVNDKSPKRLFVDDDHVSSLETNNVSATRKTQTPPDDKKSPDISNSISKAKLLEMLEVYKKEIERLAAIKVTDSTSEVAVKEERTTPEKKAQTLSKNELSSIYSQSALDPSEVVNHNHIDCRRKLVTSFEDGALAKDRVKVEDASLTSSYGVPVQSTSPIVQSSTWNAFANLPDSNNAFVASNKEDPNGCCSLAAKSAHAPRKASGDCGLSAQIKSSDEQSYEAKFSEMMTKPDANMFEIIHKMYKYFEKLKSGNEASPADEKQVQTLPEASSSELSTCKPTISEETSQQTCASAFAFADLSKTFAAAELAFREQQNQQHQRMSISDQLCERWQLELGEIERFCLERNRETDDTAEEQQKEQVMYAGTISESVAKDVGGERTQKEMEEEKRKNQEDDNLLAELFSSDDPGLGGGGGGGQNEFGYFWKLFDSPGDDLLPFSDPWTCSNDSASPPIFSLLMNDMDEEFTLDDDPSITAFAVSKGNTSSSSSSTPPQKKSHALESQLSLSPDESVAIAAKQLLGQDSPVKRTLADELDDHEEPLLKRMKTSFEAHNYLLTPPSTPVANENAKAQVDSQKDALSINKISSEKCPENLTEPSSVMDVTIPETVKDESSSKDTALSSSSSSSSKLGKSSPKNNSNYSLKNAHSKPVADRPLNWRENSTEKQQPPSNSSVTSITSKDKESVTEKPTWAAPRCCTCNQRLSGSIIDSYFTYFHRTVLSVTNQERTYIFSVSFYPLLTAESCKTMQLRSATTREEAAEKRHSQVEAITRNVNIFEKDFIIFPIERQGHWLVVIVCFPGLTGPVQYQQKEQIKKHFSPKKNSAKSESGPSPSAAKSRRTRLTNEKRNSKETADCDTGSTNKGSTNFFGSSKIPTKTSEQSQGQEEALRSSIESTPIKQPCILVFDSSLKTRRAEVVEVIKDYLRVEYKVKHGRDRDFSSFMKDDSPKVPKRTNSACCGVYMLQYADSFFNNPIVDYRLPIKQVHNWFKGDAIQRKRDEIFRFLPPRPGRPCGSEVAKASASQSQMLHLKSPCQKDKASCSPSGAAKEQRRHSVETTTTTTREETPTLKEETTQTTLTVLFDKPVEILEDCNTSDEIPFRGFTEPELYPHHSLSSPPPHSPFVADLLLAANDDNAMMMQEVVNEEEVASSDVIDDVTAPFPSPASCTSQLYVSLSRVGCAAANASASASDSNKKSSAAKSSRTRTALQPANSKLVSPNKRKKKTNCSVAVPFAQESASDVCQLPSANKAALSGQGQGKSKSKSQGEGQKGTRKRAVRMRRRNIVSPVKSGGTAAAAASPGKSVRGKVTCKDGVKTGNGTGTAVSNKDDTPIPLRTHHLNEVLKTFQKMDKKKGRRCKK